ncbi:TetR family transcriptional regulator [Pseudomonas oryzihabitans]|nr:TetR family transcriptional regulator [Pseudomonas psychrotolerans]KTT47720.1 TetR family transcriptional regulator [Pseudomonas psychrotolerans]KTT56969.1 TetR family transcriptional regulator [Pseudomonas psychrotolerans]
MTQPPDSQRPRPRKIPRQARSANTLAVIVEATARILEERGMGGFTTNAVAERAGVSIGSLYQYFPSKEALLGALIVREASGFIADSERALALASGAEILAGLIGAAVRHQLQRPALARLLDIEEARLPHDKERYEVLLRLREILATALRHPDLRLPPDLSIAQVADDVLAIIRGLADAAGARGETEQDGLQRRVSRAVLGYLYGARAPDGAVSRNA